MNAPRSRKTKERSKGSAGLPNNLLKWWRGIVSQVRARAGERSPIVLGIVLVLTTSLAMDACARLGFVPMLFIGLSYLNFVVHELGHFVTRMMPQGICVAAGTLFQLALPAGSIVMFIRQRDDAAACFAASWLALSLMHTADYMADARTQAADMTLSASFWTVMGSQPVRPDDLTHDWTYMLESCGLLKWDTTLAMGVRIVSATIALGAVLMNVFLVWFSIQDRRSKSRRRKGKGS